MWPLEHVDRSNSVCGGIWEIEKHPAWEFACMVHARKHAGFGGKHGRKHETPKKQ
jgi:hypothetical protein